MNTKLLGAFIAVIKSQPIFLLFTTVLISCQVINKNERLPSSKPFASFEKVITKNNCSEISRSINDEFQWVAGNFGVEDKLVFVHSGNGNDPLFWADASFPNQLRVPMPCMLADYSQETSTMLYLFALYHEFAHVIIDNDNIKSVRIFKEKNNIPVPNVRPLFLSPYENDLYLAHHSNIDIFALLLMKHFLYNTKDIANELLKRKTEPDESFTRRVQVIVAANQYTFDNIEDIFFKITHISGLDKVSDFFSKQGISPSFVEYLNKKSVVRNEKYVIFSKELSDSEIERFHSY